MILKLGMDLLGLKFFKVNISDDLGLIDLFYGKVKIALAQMSGEGFQDHWSSGSQIRFIFGQFLPQ